MSDSELIDAQTAVELLGCTPDELQDKVANKELRAFRSGGQMKFRREDVEELRASRSTEPTIILPSTRKPGASGILQALNDDLAMPQQQPEPIAAATNYGSFSGDPSGTQPIVIDDLDILPVSQDGMTTQDMTAAHTAVQQPIGGDDLTVMDPSMTVVDDLDHTVIDDMDQQVSTAARSSVQRVTRTQTRQEVVPSARKAQAVYVKSPSNPIMSIALIVTTLILSYAFAVMLTHAMYAPYQEVQLPNGVRSGERYVPGFVQWGADQFKTLMYESKAGK